MKRRGRLLSVVLVICLALGLMPATALAVRKTTRTARTASTRSTGTGRAVQIVDGTNSTGGIQGYDETKKDEPSKGYHYVYFGIKDNNPIKWRVLETQSGGGSSNSSSISSSIFLLSEDLQGKVAFASSGSGNTWQGSDAQKWCKAFAGDPAGSGVISPFDTGEQAALLETSGIGSSDEKVFFLSDTEAEKAGYGFDTDESRVVKDNDGPKAWWLRTSDTTNNVKAVGETGTITPTSVSSDLQARPAFNLDMSRVLFTAPASGTTTRAAGGLEKVSSEVASEWRLVLKDDSLSSGDPFEVTVPNGSVSGNSDGTKTAPIKAETKKGIAIHYKNAKTGANEYVSVILEDSVGNILYYGQIEASGSGDNDTEVMIPEDLANGLYTLKIFNEQYNGARQTGYASDFSEIYVDVKDTTSPILTPGKVERVSDTEATVQFTSNEAGTYYYKVVNHGDKEPTETDIVNGKGTRCDTAEQTVTLKDTDGMSSGAKDVYIIVKDAAGHNSTPLKIEIPARTPGKFVITASAGEGGTITPRSSSVDPGTDLTVTITPRTGYEIDTVKVDGTEISKSELSDKNEYTFKDIQADHTIEVTFKAIDEPTPTMRTLTVSASPEEGGTVKVEVPGRSTSGSYQDGTSVMVTATANEGYHFVRWTENDNQVSDSASYQFNIAANRNLVAVFEADIPTPASHTVTVSSSYAQTSGAGTYQTGATVTVQAGTRQNYRFDGWTSEDGVTFADASSATTTFTMPDKDVTVSAKWTYTGSTGTNNGTNSGTNSGNNGTTSGNNTNSGNTSGGNGTLSDGKGGTYTGDDTPTAMWLSMLCTSFGLMTVLGVLGLRRRKFCPELVGQWRGLTEKEFGQKRR